jgi:anti-anti-sigma regulatory factor
MSQGMSEPSTPFSSPFMQVTMHEDGLLIRLQGPVVGQREAGIVREDMLRVLNTLQGQFTVLILDLRDVQGMCSMALGACIDARNQAKQYGVRTMVYGMCDDLMSLMRLMKVNRLWKVLRSERQLTRVLAA